MEVTWVDTQLIHHHVSALGNVASEMAGQSVLQTNSPINRVTAALTSANKSKAVRSVEPFSLRGDLADTDFTQLARRLYYSFRAPGTDHVDIEDIAKLYVHVGLMILGLCSTVSG